MAADQPVVPFMQAGNQGRFWHPGELAALSAIAVPARQHEVPNPVGVGHLAAFKNHAMSGQNGGQFIGVPFVSIHRVFICLAASASDGPIWSTIHRYPRSKDDTSPILGRVGQFVLGGRPQRLRGNAVVCCIAREKRSRLP
jgi:hypothetical protein